MMELSVALQSQETRRSARSITACANDSRSEAPMSSRHLLKMSMTRLSFRHFFLLGCKQRLSVQTQAAPLPRCSHPFPCLSPLVEHCGLAH